MLGVSKQAAQRKYASKNSAQPPVQNAGSGARFAHPIPLTGHTRTGEVGRQRAPSDRPIMPSLGARIAITYVPVDGTR